ncbi:large-conductance mechanosensitive channel protein MscL [Peribacillus huizhouensis]|uniref:Large-conductance mechanosensitive channel n=1 Tax=Peribacillus huizhouensis TaxID=1501239 RepID=A0ABR6CQX1_9BACI|nr:large-conductance mechanosensitive channel protein MscL [Peribacillus huizhouensis]MBA9026742.1 large conductance mechanosensitive channel [Peribacillus huizhouensis]
MIKEFKEFAMRGNVIDLAIGVILGAAFGKIVTSLVNDIIMPLISLLLGVIDFTDLSYKAVKYGIFIQTIVDFIIVAISIFLFIKLFNKLYTREKKVKEAPPSMTKEEELLTEIRDLLKANQRETM